MRVCALQSGTSADGIDVLVADAEADGDLLAVTPVVWRTVPWEVGLRRDIIDAAHGTALDAAAWCALDTRLGEAFADAVAGFGDLDLVVSHGQTLYHWADGGRIRGTMQLGEPSLIAEVAGCPVISHVRHADIAAGGEGAPLMAVLDRLWLGADAADGGRPIATANIGGIANVQVVHPDGTVRAWDTGPGNALIDALVERTTAGAEGYDRNGALAAGGAVHGELLGLLQNHPYFSRPAPKTTGRHEFSLALVDEVIVRLDGPVPSDADLAATLVELTAWSLGTALVESGAAEAVLSGGGVHNPVLMRRLAFWAQGVTVASSAERGIDPDSRENLMFAVLGVLSWHGIPISLTTPSSRVAGRITPGPAPLVLPQPRPPFTRLEIRR